jgi:PPOX class probable F420-dependent enzyme
MTVKSLSAVNRRALQQSVARLGRRRDYDPGLAQDWVERMRSLLEAPSPAVLTTYRKDGSAFVRPVWFRWRAPAFEVVVAEGDVKLVHLRRDPRCVLLVFEAVPPFRGVVAGGEAELVERDVTPDRAEIAGRYLGREAGVRFAERRRGKPGVLVRIVPDEPRVWDLSAILS